jgi:hypothetical protein
MCDIRTTTDWPLPGVTYVTLYLDAVTGTLTAELLANEGVVQYNPRGGPRDRASFVYRFEHDTELTGGMTLSLWLSTSEGDDMDLFVLLRKFDATGKEVFFYGYNGFAHDGVAKGWLRVSHRELDPERSRAGRPWHTHRQRRPVQPDEVVPVEIEVLASSTHFEAGPGFASRCSATMPPDIPLSSMAEASTAARIPFISEGGIPQRSSRRSSTDEGVATLCRDFRADISSIITSACSFLSPSG